MIVIRARRWKLTLLFLLSVGMTAASAWLAFGIPIPAVFVFAGIGAVGIVGMLFFGIAGGWILSRLLSHRVSLVIHREGILGNSSAIPAGQIAWKQMSRIEITAVADQRFIGIDVHDRTALRSRRSWLQRWIENANVGVGGFPINIPATTLDRPIEQLLELIVRYWKDPEARRELDPLDPPVMTG